MAATILIVEDERPVREFLATALAEEGYHIVQAFHGRHALEQIAGRPPDLVISDVMMPMMGGVELCHQLREDPATAAIPVILMSAAGKRALSGVEAQAFIEKPFDLDVMDALVRRWLPEGSRNPRGEKASKAS